MTTRSVRSTALGLLCLALASCNCGGKTTAPPGAPVIVNVVVTPPVAAPGATVTVAAVVVPVDDYALNFTWKIPTGWTPTGATNTDTITLVAPNAFAETDQLGLTVDDGHGHASVTSIALATGMDSTPGAAISATPSNPKVGTPVTVTSQVQAAFGQSVTYAWTSQAPATSSAALVDTQDAETAFTPDVAGTYTVQLVVTDTDGLTSVPATALIVVPLSAPIIASLTATPPVVPPAGEITLTAIASSTDGYPLQYTWRIPAGWSVASGFESDGGSEADAGIENDGGLDDGGAEGDAGPVHGDAGQDAGVAPDGGDVDAGADGDAGLADSDGGDTGSGPNGSTTIVAGSTILIVAPTAVSQSAPVLLTVSDGHGQSTTTSVTVSTAADVTPTATFTASPTNPQTGSAVTLTATGTSAYNQALFYSWSMITPAGSTAVLSMENPVAKFVPDVAGSYVIQLVASDVSGTTSAPYTATLVVGAYQQPQISSVTTSAEPVPPGGTVTLTAVAQSPDGYVLSYSWMIPSGWTPVGPTDGSTLVLTAPATFSQSQDVVLTVSDGHGGSASSAVLVSTGTDTAPVASITADPSNPTIGTMVSITSMATAANGQAVTYAWSFSEQPLGSTAALASNTSATSSFTPDVPGQYIVQLVVTDQSGTPSAPATATLAVIGFVAPTIVSLNAVPAAAAPGGSETVTAVATSNDGFPVQYLWTVPDGWTAVGQTNTNTLILTAPQGFLQLGQVIVTASDGHGASATASVAVTTGPDTAPAASVTSTPSDPVVGLPVTLVSSVSAADNQAVTYQWTLLQSPDGSTATLSGSTSAQATFTPDVAGTFQAQLVVTDQSGLSSLPAVATVTAHYGSAIAVTLAYGPQNPTPGTTVNVLSQVSSLNPGSPVASAWSLTNVPVGSSAKVSSVTTPNISFVADKPGAYTAQLVVTSPLTGQSAPATVTITAKYGPPTAVIGGTAPLQGFTNIATTLDGTVSIDPAGNPLQYAWTVTSAPSGSQCAGTACFGQTVNNGKPSFTPDIPGTYNIQMTVTDSVTGQTSTATTSVVVVQVFTVQLYNGSGLPDAGSGGGGGGGTVPSGAGQVGVVHTEVTLPLVVQVVQNNGAPLSNWGLNWVVANGSIVSASSTTDKDGLGTAVVELGRVAGPVVVQASANPISATFTLTALADAPASFALATIPGTVDGTSTVSVTVVDEYGNPTTANAAANNATLQLNLQSPSGLASFSSSASLGSISFAPGSSQATITLTKGQFIGAITDSIAETVQVTLGRGSGSAPLPFSAWSTLLYDGAEAGLGNWNSMGANPSWGVESSLVKDGADAFGITVDQAQQLTTDASDLVTKSALTPPIGSAITLLNAAWNVQLDQVADPFSGCTWTSQFRPRMATSALNPGGSNYLTPVSGWGVLFSCTSLVPSLGPTTGWTQQTVDLTDSLSNNSYLDFAVSNTPDQNILPLGPSEWAIDDVWVKSLSSPSFTGASTNLVVGAGTARALVFGTASAPVELGQCVNQQAPYTVVAQAVDQFGNVTVANPTIEVDWSGASSVLTPTAQRGTLVALEPNGAQVTLQQGQAILQLPDPTADTLKFTFNPLSSGLAAGSPTTLTPTQYRCHSTGTGGTWSDTSPLSTYSAAEALNACQSVYGAGNCTTNGSYAYPTTFANGSCGTSNVFGWFYATLTIPSGPCGSSGTITPGTVLNLHDLVFSGGACSCSNSLGQTSSLSWTTSGSWN